jgi:hypothetical protein
MLRSILRELLLPPYGLIASSRQLPEICRSCRREVRTLESCVILSTHEEKRAGDVTFKESVTEKVCCLECTSVSTGGRQA